MLRPSDIAPNAVQVDEEGTVKNFMFSRDQVTFNDNGTMTMVIHGNKNDTKRHGFVIEIPPASNENICPVRTLREYINRTETLVNNKGPVFLTLNKPYRALSSAAVRTILNEAIGLVGLDTKKFTAKCFRPTGATRAVEKGFDPNVVQKIGRWKTTSVFFEHYVHSRVPNNFTDGLLTN
ncbi:integrase/recombinase xerD homolog [Macrobrachium rosenbergii]|uniref:integrase/recombinase xerD homolog n=1 Tax=Macrobrachium rosenbergii TaxID=79674 RepID=UPI0034D4575F